MFCLSHKKTKGSCIVTPNVLHFRKIWQVIRKKSAKHFGKQQEFKTLWQGRKSKKKCFSIALGHTLVVLEMH